MNVLVVEDDPTSRLVLRTYLEKAKHRVTEAENGETAVMLASNHDYDVILMDLRMPKINGVEAAKMIRKLPSQRSLVPIIAISAHV
ncbi:MAG: response regulator, partial [Rhodobacterales bacterium]